MGKQKKANANAQRNNNAKQMQERSEKARMASYAEMEKKKLESD